MKSTEQARVLTPSEAELAAELKARRLNDEEINGKILQRRELMKNGKIKPAEARAFIADASGALVAEKSNASEEENDLVKDRQREHRTAYSECYLSRPVYD